MTRSFRGELVRSRATGRCRNRSGRLLGAAALAASLLGLVAPCSCTTSGVVGGECRPGLSWCDGQCMDLRADEHNCGSCGHECRRGASCRDGVCEGSRDGSAEGGAGAAGQGFWAGAGQANRRDAGKDAEADAFGEWDASWDGSHAAAGGIGGSDTTGGAGHGNTTGETGGGDSTGGKGGAGPSGGAAGDSGAAGSECIPPFRSPSQCGDCYTVCGGSTPVCSPVDGDYQCVPRCDDPLTDCSGQCVDLQSNPDHCGSCSNRCSSRLCQAGQCVGAQAGDIVLMCMNLESVADQQKVLLGNSVFRQITAVRILSYEQYASTRAIDRVASTIDSVAGGREYSLQMADSSTQVIKQLNVIDFDVLIVHDQPNAPKGALGSIGSSWAETLDSFTRAGGTVVVLSSTDGVAEMGDLMTNTGLLLVEGQRSVTDTRLANAAPGDAIGNGVLTRFLALPETCAFDTSFTQDPENVVVVTTDPSQDPVDPVVIHRVISP